MAPKEFKYETYRKSTDLIKTRFTKLEETVTKITANVPITPVQTRQLNTIFAELKKKRADFELNLQRLIESDPEDFAESAVNGDVDEVNDLYVRISSLIEVNILLEPTTPHSTQSESTTSLQTTIATGVKLPKLNLQTFDGTPLKWISFINLFDTAVHKCTSISNVAKFQYLLSVLSGEPLNLIKSLNLTASNYVIAYNLLRERYHSPRRLTTLHLNHLLDLPSVPRSNPKQLRSFITTFYEHSESLRALDCDVTEHNPLLAAHLLRKLDTRTVQELEQHRASEGSKPHSLPTVMEIIKFLNLECSHIEDASLHSSLEPRASASQTHKFKTDKRVSFPSKHVAMTVATDTKQSSCFCCNKPGHKIYQCQVFKSKSPNDRFRLVKENKRCISCLGNHSLNDCRSNFSCRTCNKRHHSMLHFNNAQTTSQRSSDHKPQMQRTSVPRSVSEQTQINQTSSLTCTAQEKLKTHTNKTVLLSTALVKLTAINGRSFVFRALLDSGSMSDFISERAAQLLGTRRNPSNVTVTGLSQTLSHTNGSLNLDIASLSGHSVATKHSFHILEKISLDLPRVEITPEVLHLTKPFVLADPTFHKSGPIDVLLGCALFPQLLTNECHSLGAQMPYALGTIFGYVIAGTAPCSSFSPSGSHLSISLLSTADIDLHTSLQRFWTQEELPSYSKKSAEELTCDHIFETTHSRDQHGRYTVRLPFTHDNATTSLGVSMPIAEQRFHALERKLHHPNNADFRTLYSDFMYEYKSLGHMELCPNLALNEPHYFLPHHGVLKAQSSTTKLRVVFDASSKTSSGLSLNDILLTGPKLQNNICDILLHFREKNVVFSCDIRQMYRQIRIHPDDQDFQLILWRESPSSPLLAYRLTTVTYGMNCSPYLAIKTLQQLADDEGSRYPQAADILRHHTYVDDIIAGASNEEDALALQTQLIELLKLGGFELRKWVSNCPKLLQKLPSSHQESPVFMQANADPHFSILGIYWCPTDDAFKYTFNFSCDKPTKRKVLSLIARIYDPCGFLSPCIMTAKRFMQLLWTSGIAWDQPLNPDLASKWQIFVSDLNKVIEVSIPRAIMLPHTIMCDLHGFSDASETGYAAVVYLRSVDKDNHVQVTQLVAKTRAAPLKRVTLPRLELCAAHLLAQLVHYVNTQLSNKLNLNSMVLWCDSSVTLSWIQTVPYRLKTYVANRVAQIQELVPSSCWRHISGSDNPADCASRGILPSELVNHPLWWSGPSWLQLSPSDWPKSNFTPIDHTALAEVKPNPITVLVTTPHSPWDLLTRYSSWTRLVHVLAYILRFVQNSRRKPRLSGPLSVAEAQSSQLQIFKLVQQEAFSDDISALQANKTCSPRLQRLAPFIDQDGLLRVGGRLRHADLAHDIRHPCLLPKRHHIVNIYVDYIHRKHLHSGAQLTMSLLSRHVWILSARSVVRSRIFQCLVCFKQKPRNSFPLMGDLPKSRVTPARPFLSTGIDYGGPFNITIHNLRSIRHIKAYICLFVCLVTKAVHIEVVTDLTTNSFIAALTRFTARRGLCSDIYSDCATNFVGARNALQDLILTSGKQPVQTFALDHNIRFHFNPPAAPHQGGLWESAIKSVKHHLKRTLGTHVPSLIHFTTLTCQIEAMLNSRPLTALSSDANDLQALTPGHFLIGAPLAAIPETDFIDTPDNRLNKWQLTQALTQRIWKRWSQEYLHTLQQRLKWHVPTRNLQVGDLVLIHQDSPSLMWPLARITRVTKGKDDVVRVVELKTRQGTLTRPAVKVFLLPFMVDMD